MNKFLRCLLTVIIVLIIMSISGPASAQTSLNPMLKTYLSQYELPALAAAVVKKGKVIAAGAVGTRRAGENIPVTINDRFHIGSDTKAMTALLAAMIVEEGKLCWNTTIAEVFPELAEKMDTRLQTVTLEQFLSHTSGIPADNEDMLKVLFESYAQEGNLDELRYWIVRAWSTYPLAAEPRTKFAYSNMGYVFVGAIIERRTGGTWDELITERVFRPLKMQTAGLGPQSSIGKIDAPLGHSGFNLPVQMTPVPGTGDDKTKTAGYWLGCPGVTGNVNNACPDATMIQETDKYPFGTDFQFGIALKNASGSTIACWNGCSYKTRSTCKTDGLPCRKDQDCVVLKVCSGDDSQSCTKDSDCTDPQTCVDRGQGCIPPEGNPNLLPEAADYCCDASAYCHTLGTDSNCGSKKRCPATAISAFYKALAPSAYAYTMGEDDWSTFNAGWKGGVGHDYYIEFCSTTKE